MHAVGPGPGEREVEIAIAIDVGPLHAVVGLESADDRRRDIHERGAGVAQQRVLPADATGDGAVHVEIQPAVVIDIGRCAGVVARVDGQAPLGGSIVELTAATVAEEPERPVVGGHEIEVAVGVEVGGAQAHRAAARMLRRPAAPGHARRRGHVDESAVRR